MSAEMTVAAEIAGRPGAAHERRALGIALGVTVTAVAGVVGAWFLMRAAMVRLTPLPPSAPKVDLAALGVDEEAFKRGQEFFAGTCVTCHGVDLMGLPNSGKPLKTSEFVKSLTVEQLAAFLAVGRPSWDEANTTGIDMPSKGGNPVLMSEHLKDIAVYVKAVRSASGS